MGVIKLQYVVSFSSQDEKYPIDNIINNATKNPKYKWLNSVFDKSGRLEAEFQLEKSSVINFLNIGNSGSATIELEVGRSSWPRDKAYVSFLPAVVMMTINDCKNNTNYNSVRMFDKQSVNQEAANQKWDRIRIICTQPYLKNTQFGIAFLELRSLESDTPMSSVAENTSNRDDILFRKLKSSYFISPKSRAQQMVDAARSRHTKLVKKSENMSNNKSSKASFEEEVMLFLTSLDIHKFNWQETTVRDLREQFEGHAKRQLDTEDKDTFMRLTLNFAESEVNKYGSESDEVLEPSPNEEEKVEALTTSLDNKFDDICNQFLKQQVVSPQQKISKSLLTSRVAKKTPNGSSVNFDKLFNAKRNGTEEPNVKDSSPKPSMSKNAKPVTPKRKQLFGPVSSTKSPKISRSNVQTEEPELALIQCPICEEFYFGNEIEEHAAGCTSSTTNDPPIQQAFHECPICCDFFPENEINVHANQCIPAN